MTRFLIVCGAGALGCGARYLVGLWAAERFGTRLPYGTLIVNIVGSFLIALVIELSIRLADFSPNLRLALTTGFLGGLTTYSSFNYETTQLAFTGQTMRALANVVLTLVACLVAGLLGILVARRFGG
ncbi:MAG: fluoride efflux transporter CrcB [Deltaproteobacteria bacterium]|nr:fluoride efflux transporter CrcB [Deltaproteobacteria bacterium]